MGDRGLPAAGGRDRAWRCLLTGRIPSSAAAMASAAALLAAAAGCGPAPSGGGDGSETERGAVEAAVPEIQGEGHLSPLAGREVITSGVVTAADSGLFYLQDPGGDGDAATSDAVLVESAGAPPSPGDSLRVTGAVEEHVPGGEQTANLSVTRIDASEVRVLAEDAALPEPVRLGSPGRIPPRVRVIGRDELPVDLRDPDEAASNPFDPDGEGIDFYESLEGMRVVVASPVTVSPTESFGEGEAEVWTLVEGGAHITPDDARTAAGGILLQPHPDNRGDHNPERVQVQFDRHLYPGAAPELAVGSSLSDVTGVVGYSFGNFEVNATREIEVDASRPEPGPTSLEGGAGRVTVATYNVLDLDPLPETAGRMERLGRQIAVGLKAPAVVALQEIRDSNGTRGGAESRETDASGTLRALADAVESAGGPRYEHVDVAPEPNTTGGVPGGNIRNAFLYDPARVELIEVTSLTPEVLRAADARDPEAFEEGRDPLAATFSVDGSRFTVVNNHFTSRYGSTPVFGAVQPFVQAGEEEREAQSRAVHDWVSRRLEEEPGAGVAVVGDLNTFEFTDDLATLLPGGDEPVLVNLVRDLPREERYSYNFEGNSQALDHVFVTEALAAGARIDAVHVSSDLPSGRAASDHDPMVASFSIP